MHHSGLCAFQCCGQGRAVRSAGHVLAFCSAVCHAKQYAKNAVGRAARCADDGSLHIRRCELQGSAQGRAMRRAEQSAVQGCGKRRSVRMVGHCSWQDCAHCRTAPRARHCSGQGSVHIWAMRSSVQCARQGRALRETGQLVGQGSTQGRSVVKLGLWAGHGSAQRMLLLRGEPITGTRLRASPGRTISGTPCMEYLGETDSRPPWMRAHGGDPQEGTPLIGPIGVDHLYWPL